MINTIGSRLIHDIRRAILLKFLKDQRYLCLIPGAYILQVDFKVHPRAPRNASTGVHRRYLLDEVCLIPLTFLVRRDRRPVGLKYYSRSTGCAV